MYPTRLQIKTRFQALLDDPSGSVFSDAVFTEAFGEAYDALFTAFLTNQCPRIEQIIDYTLPPNTTFLQPATMGATDFAGYIYFASRITGSGAQFRDMVPVERLPDCPMGDSLSEFLYVNDVFYFTGSNNSIDLRLSYFASGEAPTNDATQIQVDGTLTFLANYAVGVAGQRKGYDEIAQRCMQLAVGPKYDQGTIGGELFRIVQARVRSTQKVQIAPKPFSAFRRLDARRAAPYVAVQQGTTGGSSQNLPIQFSTADGTIVGAIDGTNTVFWLITGVSQAIVYRNGVLQTANTNYTRASNQITFFPGSVPQPGDILTAQGYS